MGRRADGNDIEFGRVDVVQAAAALEQWAAKGSSAAWRKLQDEAFIARLSQEGRDAIERVNEWLDASLEEGLPVDDAARELRIPASALRHLIEEFQE